jgi:hypothetical protein
LESIFKSFRNCKWLFTLQGLQIDFESTAIENQGCPEDVKAHLNGFLSLENQAGVRPLTATTPTSSARIATRHDFTINVNPSNGSLKGYLLKFNEVLY